jgi:formate dehydrogenase gamma subunit
MPEPTIPPIPENEEPVNETAGQELNESAETNQAISEIVLPPTSQTEQEITTKQLFKRFSILDRIEHWVFISSFLILGLTGLVQRYSESPIAQAIIQGSGGIEMTRSIHHVAAILMMLSVIYHIGAVGYKIYVRRVRMSMLPTPYDFSAAWDTVKYFLGIKKHPAQQGRFTFEEKVEYWAVVWGTIVMGLTGFMMWNPILTTRFLDGQFIPAAKYAHSMEAVLAVLSIFLWHFYHIFVKTFNKSMFNGKLDKHQMVEEHPLELADIKAGLAERPTDPQKINQRKKIFYPTYGVVAALMLVGVIFFVTYEETAITTVPPSASTEEVFVPLTPTPLPTQRPTATSSPIGEAPTWENSIAGIFADRCTSCHGEVAKLGDLDLSTYDTAIQGGKSGPAIIPGNPDESLLIQLQEAGGHPGQLTESEIALVREWITAEAPEE